MPTLETPDGKPVEVTPVDADAVNAQFNAAMNDDGPDEQAPPKRQPKPSAEVEIAKPRTARPPKAEKARTTSAKAATALDDGQRANGVKGLAQIGAGITLLLGKATKDRAKSDAFKADAVTIASAAGAIADACVQTAKADPKFAAALDKVCNVGPYAALVSVMVGVGSQIARNHKPDLKIPGTTDPAELLKVQDETEKVAA